MIFQPIALAVKNALFVPSKIEKGTIMLISFILISMISLIIGEVFLAFAIYKLLFYNYAFEEWFACLITAVILILEAFSFLWLTKYFLKRSTPIKFITSEYDQLKKALSAFIRGFQRG